MIVVNSGPASHIEYQWEEAAAARALRRLASFSRLVLYDNRGVGLSDPIAAGNPPTIEDEMDDIMAVLEEVGSQRAVLLGNLAGGAPSILFAAT
jgi:pimeloyl-ACP methyl ester carboxylesterase